MKRFLPAVIFFGFILWIISEANQGVTDNLFIELVRHIPAGDKLGHALLYGALTGLSILALNGRVVSIFRLRLPLGAVIVCLFALLEELTQFYLPNRTFDWGDILFDMLGIIIFGWGAQKLVLSKSSL